jgi:hypothetical protein
MAAPWSANPNAMLRPMLRLAPVITARCPDIENQGDIDPPNLDQIALLGVDLTPTTKRLI